MSGALLIIILVALVEVPRADSFEFSVSRNINSVKVLDKSKWSTVEILEPPDCENNCVKVKVNIPVTLPYSDIFIFFANDAKEILRLTLNETIQGTYYDFPYKAVKKMEGDKTIRTRNEDYEQVSNEFPVSWLPKNSTKVSAAVLGLDGTYYNYYGLQNLNISFPDLMVLEEYQNYQKL